MKKLIIVALSLTALMLLASGCVVRAHHGVPVAHVFVPAPPPPPRAVVFHAPAPRPMRRCHEQRCRRVCNLWGCFDRCHRVAFNCY